MIDETTNRLLMSDELKGNVPELEDEQIAAMQDAFVIVLLELVVGSTVYPVAGSLVGISCEKILKLDLRVDNKIGYDLITNCLAGKIIVCNAYSLVFIDRETRIVGPFSVSSPKLLDFDRQAKMCTLAIDLIKVS